MLLSGTRDTTSSEFCLLINHYKATVCKCSVLVRTALHAGKDFAHCNERNNKQDLSIPQELLRSLENICITMKAKGPAQIPEIKTSKGTMQRLHL